MNDKDEAFKFTLQLVGDDEQMAFEIVAALASKFGWAGTYFTEVDIKNRWKQLYGEAEPPPDLTKLVREDVRWHPVLTSRMMSAGLEQLDAILRDLYLARYNQRLE